MRESGIVSGIGAGSGAGSCARAGPLPDTSGHAAAAVRAASDTTRRAIERYRLGIEAPHSLYRPVAYYSIHFGLLMSPDRLNALFAVYRDGLLHDTLPFWTRHAIDRVHGGYITALDRDGSILQTDKPIWVHGRFAWLLA